MRISILKYLGIGLLLSWGAFAYADQPLELTEMEALLKGKDYRAELKFDASGKLLKIEIDKDLERLDKVEDKVKSIDLKARQVTLEHLGVVFYGKAIEFELRRSDSHLEAWEKAVSEELKNDRAVYLEAKGKLSKKGFEAEKLELEGPDKPQLKVAISQKNLNKGKEEIHIGNFSWSLKGVRLFLDD